MIAGVPYDAEIEYIESTSARTQRIDTGVIANETTKVTLDMMKMNAVPAWEFGARNGAVTAVDKFGLFVFETSGTTKLSAQIGNEIVEPIFSGAIVNTRRLFELSLVDGIAVDGQTIGTFSDSAKSQTFSGAYQMALFNLRTGSSTFNTGILARLFSSKIWQGGSLVRDFIPVRVGTVGYMYDRVTRKMFGNKGTGAFTIGPDVAKPVMGVWRYA